MTTSSLLKNKTLWLIGGVVVLVGIIFCIYEYFSLQKAHSTFENYYAFRGCTTLLEKADTTATCQLANGTVLHLMSVDGKWYLEGDGPGKW